MLVIKNKYQRDQLRVAHAFNPITWVAEAKNLGVRDQLGIQSEFLDSQVYTE